METFEQQQIRQLNRINAQLNPGPALLKALGLIFALLIALAALACFMNSQRSDLQAATMASRHRIAGKIPALPGMPMQRIDERSKSR